MTDEQGNEKSKFLLDRVNEAHPKFLEAIKEASPLAVLGSLCIAISGFTYQNFPEALPFAITSATLFLIAFVISLSFKILANGSSLAPVLSIATYVSSGLGIILLFGVLYSFGKAIPLLNDRLMSVIPIIIVILGVIFGLVVWGFNDKFKNILEKVPLYLKISNVITIVAALCMVLLGIFNSLNAFFHLSNYFSMFESVRLNALQIGASYFAGINVLVYALLAKRANKNRKKYPFDPSDDLIGCAY